MCRILNIIKNKNIFELRLDVDVILETVVNFLIGNYGDELPDVPDIESYLFDSISLYDNDWDDVAISFNESLERLEKKLTEDGLITEGVNCRATNLCCKALAEVFHCDDRIVDIWTTDDPDCLRIQLPINVMFDLHKKSINKN